MHQAGRSAGRHAESAGPQAGRADRRHAGGAAQSAQGGRRLDAAEAGSRPEHSGRDKRRGALRRAARPSGGRIGVRHQRRARCVPGALSRPRQLRPGRERRPRSHSERRRSGSRSRRSRKLGQQGFVVSTRREFPTFLRGYAEIYTSHLPLYVSVDSILESVHSSYDQILLGVERAILIPELKALLTGMHGRIAASDAEASVKRDADFYLVIARGLLDGTVPQPVAGADRTRAISIVDRAGAAEGIENIQLFDVKRMEDFSQFKPRGHYTGDPELERYFRSMMWLGRVDLRLLETQDGRQSGVSPRAVPGDAADARADRSRHGALAPHRRRRARVRRRERLHGGARGREPRRGPRRPGRREERDGRRGGRRDRRGRLRQAADREPPDGQRRHRRRRCRSTAASWSSASATSPTRTCSARPSTTASGTA